MEQQLRHWKDTSLKEPITSQSRGNDINRKLGM